jgi:CheY-like chemotaxis protein
MEAQEKKVRVVVAADRPDVRAILVGIAERDTADVVGEAETAAEALDLIRDLKPDMALIDYHIPHVHGSDDSALSRTGGLDVAQAVAEGEPDTAVILLGNLDAQDAPDRALRWNGGIFAESGPEPDDLIQQQAHGAGPPHGRVIFANALSRPLSMLTRGSTLSEKLVFFGGLGIVAGIVLMVTLVLAPVGAWVAAIGVAAVASGLMTRRIARLWSRTRGAAG